MHQEGALLSRVLDGWASPAGETAPRRAKQDIPGPAAATSGKAGDSFRRSLPSTAWGTLSSSTVLPEVPGLPEGTFHRLRDGICSGVCSWSVPQGGGQHWPGYSQASLA